MIQQMAMTNPESIAVALAVLPRDDQKLVKGFILGLSEKAARGEQAREPTERQTG